MPSILRALLILSLLAGAAAAAESFARIDRLQEQLKTVSEKEHVPGNTVTTDARTKPLFDRFIAETDELHKQFIMSADLSDLVYTPGMESVLQGTDADYVAVLNSELNAARIVKQQIDDGKEPDLAMIRNKFLPRFWLVMHTFRGVDIPWLPLSDRYGREILAGEKSNSTKARTQR